MPLSELEGRHESAGPKVSRKSHRKSRNGCQNCKQRRVKCNEEKPECNNCIKHSDKCSFLLASRIGAAPHRTERNLVALSASPTIANGSPGSIEGSIYGQSRVLNIMDLELLHNYSTSTASSITNIAGLQSFYRINVPKFAFSHPFVLHSVLAISALHLSHFKKGDAQMLYRREAEHHHEIALRTAASLLQTINEHTIPPLYLFGTFCTLITLAIGPKPGDFLLFGNHTICGWLTIFRGMKTIGEMHYEFLRQGELGPIFHISLHHINRQQPNDEHLKEVRELISSTASEDPDLPLYLKILDDLAVSYPTSMVPGTRSSQTSPEMVFVWLHRIPDEFLELLHLRRPVPLIILAYFCVLLNDLSAFWWVKGWAEHLMSEIHASLSEEYRMWMRWPMEEIGWLPG